MPSLYRLDVADGGEDCTWAEKVDENIFHCVVDYIVVPVVVVVAW